MDTNNEIVQKVMRRVADCDFLHHLGIVITHVEEGKVEGTVPLKKELRQQQGIAHGGLIATIADSVAGFAAVSVTSKEDLVFTVELKISYLRAAKGENLLAKGWVLKRGRTLHFCEAEVWDGETLVSKATATMAVVKK